ncbi:MAG: PqqD family protein, partial [Thermodesulfobacteriota bacterium]
MAGSPLPQFRADLEVLPSRRGSRKAGYILRDPHTEWVFELGEEDYFICQQLDGRTSFATLQARYEERFGETFSPAELDAFLEQLRRCGFLRETASVSPEELEDVWGQEDHGKIYRFPLVHTDGFFSWLAPRVRWVFTRQFVWLSLP